MELLRPEITLMTFVKNYILNFCKFILGVHKKKTPIFAVLSELGRFPLYYDII